MSTDIIVIGMRINGAFWGYGLDESGGYRTGGFHEHPQLDPGGGGGVEWENDLYEVHNALCDTAKDAALSIAETIKATDDAGSTNNWKRYEYGAVIEQRESGRVGAFRNKVYTDWQPNFAKLGAPANNPDSIKGTVHNHTVAAGASLPEKNFASYPSDEDIDRRTQLVTDGKFPATASIFIIDPFGDTREFAPSSLAYFRSLSDDAKKVQRACLRL